MSDLFSSLREPEQLPLPPVSDVRRRGDSLRRRRQALQAGGVAAVVVAVALAAVGVSGGFADRSSSPPVATQPTTAPVTPSPSRPVTRIPDDVDLVGDWKDGDGAGEEEVLRVGPQVQWLGDVVACDASHSPRDEDVDHLAVTYSVPQHSSSRDLRVYADEVTAQRVASDFVSWFRDCPSFSLDGGASQTVNQVTSDEVRAEMPTGAQWTVTQTYTSGGQPQLGQNILLVRQVGNAVLVVKDEGEGPGATDPATMQRQVQELWTRTRPLVDELGCTFGAAGGC